MTKINQSNQQRQPFNNETIAAVVMAALIQHGTIQRKHSKQNYVKKESEWKKKRINGLR